MKIIMYALALFIIFSEKVYSQDILSSVWTSVDWGEIKAVSNDGRRFICVKEEKVAVIDAIQNKTIYVFTALYSQSKSGFIGNGEKIWIAGEKTNVYNVVTGEQLSTFNLDNVGLIGVIFSNDCSICVSKHNRYPKLSLKLWNTTNGMILRTIDDIGSNQLVYSEFNEKEDRFIVVTANGLVRSFDPETGNEVSRYNLNTTFDTRYFTIDKKGDKITAVVPLELNSFVVKSWNLSDTSENFVISDTSFNNWVSNIWCSKNAGVMVVTNLHNKTRVWDIERGKFLYEFDEDTLWLDEIYFNKTGDKMIVGKNNIYTVNDTKTGKELQRLEVLKWDFNRINNHFQDTIIVVSEERKMAYTVDVNTGKTLSIIITGFTDINSAEFNPIGDRIIVASNNESACILNAETGEPTSIVNANGAYKAVFNSIGNKVAVCNKSSAVTVVDVATNKVDFSTESNGDQAIGLSFGTDGSRVVVADKKSDISIFDTKTGEKVYYTQVVNGSGLQSLSMSEDGTRCLVSYYGGGIKARNTINGNRLFDYDTEETIGCTAFSPTENRIALGDFKGTVYVYNIDTDMEVHKLDGHDFFIGIIRYNNAGTIIASASWNGEIRIWDAKLGKLLHTIDAHNGFINTMEFSNDGSMLLTAGDDATAKIWDVEKGVLVAIMNEHNKEVLTAHFNANGNGIVTTSADNTVKVWDVHKISAIDEKSQVPSRVLNLYPNPVHDNLTVQLHSRMEQSLPYTLTTHLGEIVQQGIIPENSQSYGIDIHTLPAGMYIFSTQVNGKSFVEKILINK